MKIERNAVHPFLRTGDLVRRAGDATDIWRVHDNYVDRDGDIKVVREDDPYSEWRYAHVDKLRLYAPGDDEVRHDEIDSATTVDTLKEEVWAAFSRHYDPTSGAAKLLAADFAKLGITPKKKKWRAVAEIEAEAPPTPIATVFGKPVEWVEVTDGDD